MTAVPWQDSAACRDWVVVFDQTFDSHGRGPKVVYDTAAAVCGSCRVRAVCLDDALRNENTTNRYGVRGGLTASQRASRARQSA